MSNSIECSNSNIWKRPLQCLYQTQYQNMKWVLKLNIPWSIHAQIGKTLSILSFNPIFSYTYKKQECSGRKKLCMVSYHSCHIYEIWTRRSKKVWGTLHSHQLGWKCKPEEGGSFYKEEEFSLCNTVFSNFTLSLNGYCKRFYRIPLSTILLLLYLFCIYWD